jgi:hypothetical protein
MANLIQSLCPLANDENLKGKTVMNKQDMKFVARILENLPAMTSIAEQEWIDNPLKLQKFLAGLASTSSKDTTHLTYLESTTIAPTLGNTTLAEAHDVFPGFLDPDFKRWGTDVTGIDTKESPVDIYEMKKNGDYRTLFGSLGAELNSLCFQQGQIKEFCRTKRHLLRQDGYATFFLFKVGEELFVAHALVGGRKLKAYVDRFVNDDAWYADAVLRHRLVVPQQTL